MLVLAFDGMDARICWVDQQLRHAVYRVYLVGLGVRVLSVLLPTTNHDGLCGKAEDLPTAIKNCLGAR